MTDPADSDAQETIGLPAETAEDLEGRQIGDYKVLRLINRGGMGAVYLAVREFDGFEKRVALKLLRPAMEDEEEIRWRFRTEARILAALDHPSIAQFLDAGTTPDGRSFFAMEYVEGEQIDRYCDSQRLSTRQRLELFRTVAKAVHFAHQNTVVHRDIKPANIMVTADGTPKLLDFGIAKLTNPELTSRELAPTVLRPYTPEFASPEQVRGQPITTASDVYSLGVLLYEMLTGHRPYRFKSYMPSEVERTISDQEPERLSTAVMRSEEVPGPRGTSTVLSPESVSRARHSEPGKLRRRLSGDLDNIVLMALRKEPQRRYASAEQFSDDVRRHLEGLPVLARRPTFSYRAGKFIRRHRFGAAVAALLLAAIVGFGIVMAIQRARTADALRQAQRERRSTEQVKAFLIDLFEISDPFKSGEDVSARELLDAGADKLSRDLDDQPLIQAELKGIVGVVYQQLGFLDRASPLLESALATHRELLGGEHPKTAASLDDLGGLRYQTGDYETSEELLRQALALRRQLLGEDHRDTAESLNNLGVLLQAKGDYDQSETLLREALEKRRRLNDPTDLAESLNDLAGVLKDKGDYASAESLLREALELYRRHLGNEHPLTATSLNNLAFLLKVGGDYDEAETLYREVLEILRQRFGDQHIHIAAALNNLAGVLQSQEDYEAAEPLYREALAMRRELLGDGHPEVAQGLHNLASVLQARGDLRAAEPLYREAISILRRGLGDRHPYVAFTRVALANLLVKRQQAAAAEPLAREALASLEATLPPGHWQTAWAKSTLGDCLTVLRRYEEAEPLLLEGHAAIQAQRGDGSPQTLRSLERLAALYDALGRTDEAARYRSQLP